MYNRFGFLAEGPYLNENERQVHRKVMWAIIGENRRPLYEICSTQRLRRIRAWSVSLWLELRQSGSGNTGLRLKGRKF